MWGYRLHRWGRELVWEEVSDPIPEDGEVVVEVESCGIGSTVLNAMAGDLADERVSLPRIPGHELVGRVVASGSDSDSDLVGARVAAYFYLYCGACAECLTRREQRCLELGGFVGVHRDGGYAPLVALPRRNAVTVPDDLDPVLATVIPDAVATPLHVVNRAHISVADKVAVIGAGGGVGIHMVQVAMLTGATVAGMDIGDAKLARIAALGAAPVESTELSAVGSGVVEGERPTVVVDLVGTGDSLRWGSASLAPGGRQVVLTTPPRYTFPISPRALVFAEAALLGSRYASVEEVRKAVELVHHGLVEPVIGKVVSPSEILLAHNSLLQGALVGRAAVDWQTPS